MRKLSELNFENTYARLTPNFHQHVAPTPVPDPYLAAFNPDAAKLIDLDPGEAARPEFLQFFSGNLPLPGSEPVAMRYAGHQFGVYVPQLGDGRAILLGEVRNGRAEKWDLHLKGAGRTAFSRFGDGRAVLRSSIREYLCSEAMHALGIPTSRALCVVGTDMEVHRESVETGALLLRLAPSHVRFGSFEVFYYHKEHEALRLLADYVIDQHFSHLRDEPDRYRRLFEEVVLRTARLVAQWQAVGFAHGVLNTDNMSILGLTLDYGPFGFMEDFDPGFICNHSDEQGRYAFDRQAEICYWNLACLAQGLLPLVPKEGLLETLNKYGDEFNRQMHQLMCAKLGLRDATDDDRNLWIDLMNLLAKRRADYTIFFRNLGDFANTVDADNHGLREMFCDPADWADWTAWAGRYRQRLAAERSEDDERRERMNRVNPRFILRNYLAQTAIDKAVNAKDFSEIDCLLGVLRRPFDEQPGLEGYSRPSPEWGKHLVVSCSS
jgi:serine/tyrosine/threonine adenylyltransferase